MDEPNEITPSPEPEPEETPEAEAPEVVAHSDDEGEETPWCIMHSEKQV